MLATRVSYLLLASVACFAAINAQAQTLVSARILSSSGPVEIQRRAQGQATAVKITYRVDDELLAGDVIKTFKNGRLVLGLSDGSQAIISEQTTVEITDLAKSPRTIFNLLRGKTRIKIEKVGGRPNPYRVNTPTAVIAVRGTLFDVFVTQTETQVFVHEGEVAVSSLVALEAPVILSPGQRTRVLQTQSPETPSPFQPGRNDDTFKPHPPDQGPYGAAPGERGANGHGMGQPGNGPNPGTPPPPTGPPPPGQNGSGKPPDPLPPDND
ncbi:MAG: hypothetical protein DMF64_01560 [Acidobacteria bacterium]|nr:MAG: hypothetical protein DMF64_01560 [Acidobacteriota bacterium]